MKNDFLRPVAVTVLLAVLCGQAQASTMDEIKQLWRPEGMGARAAQAPVAPVGQAEEAGKAASLLRLSNGRQADLRDWKVVLFMQGSCGYCHRFDPVLKSLSEKVGFGVMAYTLDGQGDAAFPDALPAPAEVMKTFFPNIPVATPTTFLVNVNTLEALPLLQGATDEQGFMARIDTVLQMYRGGHQ